MPQVQCGSRGTITCMETPWAYAMPSLEPWLSRIEGDVLNSTTGVRIFARHRLCVSRAHRIQAS
eukprot:1392588-Prymnesium_polylepis.1